MFYIARIPPTENPDNPGFHEFLAGGDGKPYLWTPRPSEGLRFSSGMIANLRLASLPAKFRKGAFVKDGPMITNARIVVAVDYDVEPPADPLEQAAQKYRDRRTRD